jgi:hypothetical protein
MYKANFLILQVKTAEIARHGKQDMQHVENLSTREKTQQTSTKM